MSDSLALFLISAITALATTVSSLAIYIWRQERERRITCERTVEGYEGPVRAATKELLASARMERRKRENARQRDGDPWPWPDSLSTRGPRRPRGRE